MSTTMTTNLDEAVKALAATLAAAEADDSAGNDPTVEAAYAVVYAHRYGAKKAKEEADDNASDDDERAISNAKAQLEHVTALGALLRLLENHPDGGFIEDEDEDENDIKEWKNACDACDLEAAFVDGEVVLEEISNHGLSITFRAERTGHDEGWSVTGYEWLLSPACRIVYEHGTGRCEWRCEWQDWGKPWTELDETPDSDADRVLSHLNEVAI